MWSGRPARDARADGHQRLELRVASSSRLAMPMGESPQRPRGAQSLPLRRRKFGAGNRPPRMLFCRGANFVRRFDEVNLAA